MVMDQSKLGRAIGEEDEEGQSREVNDVRGPVRHPTDKEQSTKQYHSQLLIRLYLRLLRLL
jgi:hypothetical protein